MNAKRRCSGNVAPIRPNQGNDLCPGDQGPTHDFHSREFLVSYSYGFTRMECFPYEHHGLPVRQIPGIGHLRLFDQNCSNSSSSQNQPYPSTQIIRFFVTIEWQYLHWANSLNRWGNNQSRKPVHRDFLITVGLEHGDEVGEVDGCKVLVVLLQLDCQVIGEDNRTDE
jgi:hypothetical protein